MKASSIVIAFVAAALSACTTDLSKFGYNGDKQKLSLTDSFVHSVNELPKQKKPLKLQSNLETELSSQFRHDDIEKLPSPVQDTIEKIKMAKTVEEKANIAFKFSKSYLKISNEGEEDYKQFLEIAQDPAGDCDDFATLNMGLLALGNVKREDIMLFAGTMRYHVNGEYFDTVNHMVLLVKDRNNQLLMLDNKLRNISVIDSNQIKGVTEQAVNKNENTIKVEIFPESSEGIFYADGKSYSL